MTKREQETIDKFLLKIEQPVVKKVKRHKKDGIYFNDKHKIISELLSFSKKEHIHGLYTEWAITIPSGTMQEALTKLLNLDLKDLLLNIGEIMKLNLVIQKRRLPDTYKARYEVDTYVKEENQKDVFIKGIVSVVLTSSIYVEENINELYEKLKDIPNLDKKKITIVTHIIFTTTDRTDFGKEGSSKESDDER